MQIRGARLPLVISLSGGGGPSGGRPPRAEANARAERNYVGTQLQHLLGKHTHTHTHIPLLPSWSVTHTRWRAAVGGGRGWVATLRLDILSVAQIFGRRWESRWNARGPCQHTDAIFVNTHG